MPRKFIHRALFKLQSKFHFFSALEQEIFKWIYTYYLSAKKKTYVGLTLKSSAFSIQITFNNIVIVKTIFFSCKTEPYIHRIWEPSSLWLPRRVSPLLSRFSAYKDHSRWQCAILRFPQSSACAFAHRWPRPLGITTFVLSGFINNYVTDSSHH